MLTNLCLCEVVSYNYNFRRSNLSFFICVSLTRKYYIEVGHRDSTHRIIMLHYLNNMFSRFELILLVCGHLSVMYDPFLQTVAYSITDYYYCYI